MATLHASGDERAIYVKGAAETLLPRCTSALAACGSTAAIDRDEVLRQMEAMASKGLRVLLLARTSLKTGRDVLDHADVAAGLTFLGLQGMIDPPRPEAIPPSPPARPPASTSR
jgi:cation-transporting P-type ATPase F